MMHRILQPDGWPRPRGYANGISAHGRQVHVAGQIGWDSSGALVGTDLVAQARQALRNIVEILACDDARPEHLVRLTWYVVDRDAYLASARALGDVYLLFRTPEVLSVEGSVTCFPPKKICVGKIELNLEHEITNSITVGIHKCYYWSSFMDQKQTLLSMEHVRSQ